jgi:hypothetical protein
VKTLFVSAAILGVSLTAVRLIREASAGEKQEAGLVGHWKLAGDCRDYSGQSNHGVNHGVDLTTGDGARFDGIDDFIEVPVTDALTLGKEDFSIASQVFVQAEGVLITIVWSAVVAVIAYKIVDLVIGLRVPEDEEREGLDITSHGETAYSK